MANLSPLNLQTLGNAQHYFRYEKRDQQAANAFCDFITGLSQSELETNKEAKQAKLMETLKCFSICSKAIDNLQNRSLKYIHESGTVLLTEMHEANKETLQPLIKKIKSFVKEQLTDPNTIREILENEATYQEELIRSSQAINAKKATQQELQGKAAMEVEGLSGLLEITKRNHMQYNFASQGQNYKYLPVMAKLIDTLIRSFSQVKGGPTEKIGIEMLSALTQQIVIHHESLQGLYIENTPTAYLIQRLIKIKGEQSSLENYYQNLKAASQYMCFRSFDSSPAELGQGDLLTFFSTKAAVIGDQIPQNMKRDNSQVTRITAQGFKAQEDHGQGARITGEESLVRNQADMYGSGINESVTLTPVDPFSPMSRDNLESERMRQKAKEFGIKIANDYFINHQLVSSTVTYMGSTEIAEPIHDPIPRAIMTVKALIPYKIALRIQQEGRLFDYDQNEKERLAPIMANEIIAFGINHDMFSREQIGALLRNFPSARNDWGVQEAGIRALVRVQIREAQQNSADPNNTGS